MATAPERVSGRLEALGRRSLFSVGGVTFTWDDVLASAAANGSLERLHDDARRGSALVRQLKAQAGELDPKAVTDSAKRFRYDRHLLSAEELDAWLERWDLTVGEWGEYLERALLLEHWAGEPETAGSTDEGAPDETEFVDAVCSGLLEREAQNLAADAALASIAADDAGERETLLERIAAAAAAARAAAASESGVKREIARRGLDWTMLELDALELDDLETAREAALCVRLDGRELSDVASDCDASLEPMSLYLADLERALQPPLLAAQPGELIGPVEHDGGFGLYAIHGRTPPSESDPELRGRAERALVERATARAMEERVEWHERRLDGARN